MIAKEQEKQIIEKGVRKFFAAKDNEFYADAFRSLGLQTFAVASAAKNNSFWDEVLRYCLRNIYEVYGSIGTQEYCA
jgi:protoporphyrinogen oxidase